MDDEDRAEFTELPFSTMSFEEFAITRAKAACQADGPDGSIACPSLARRVPFTNRFDLEGVGFYLRQVEERFHPPSTSRRDVGPIYSVHLPFGKFDKVLTFKFTEKGQDAHLDGELLRQIAASVRLAH